MDAWKALLGKADSAARPGRNGDPGAEGYKSSATIAPATLAQTGQYVTWSGTTATVHTRLMFGVTGHGLGSELV